MRTFSIDTLGCKVNQYETQQIRELLVQFGLCRVETSSKPDLIVINTCCVTHTASAKSRQCIRKAHRQSPDAVVVVCGCLPTIHIGELSAPAENVHLVRNRGELAAMLIQITNGKAAALDTQDPQSCPNNIIEPKKCSKIKHKNGLANGPKLPQLTCFEGQTRAFLKIQDGCDGYCTYCIVPKTRPFVRSKPVDAAIREAQALVKAGHREIVLTGIFLGAYGQKSVRRRNWPNQQNDNLADLLDRMAEIPDLARVRLSSLEPADVTPRLLDTFCKHRNIMPHLHLPLQSGSNTILRKMCRQYGAEEFREKIELIESRLDRPAITTDIIVGFPGETDVDFQQTVDLAKDVGFAKIHVFSFSPRKGTAAADMQDAISNRVMKKRSEILHVLDVELGFEYRQQFIGEAAQILLESYNGHLCGQPPRLSRPVPASADARRGGGRVEAAGRSERYFMVHLKEAAEELRKNDLVTAKLVNNGKSGTMGGIFLTKQP